MAFQMDFSTNPPQMGAVIRGQAPVTSLSFHEDGSHLFVASEQDNKLRLIDCQKGDTTQPATKFEKEGVSLVEATHHNYSVLVTGKNNPTQPGGIHYLSLYDNKILRSYRAHTETVTDISMCPVDDCFLSSSTDRTVRLWTLRQAAPLAKLDLPASATEGTPHVAYDSTGLVFGVTAATAGRTGHMIHLYDARKYTAGAFAEMSLAQSSLEDYLRGKGLGVDVVSSWSRAEWTSLKFNTSGKQMLVTTTAAAGVCLMLDGFDGSVTQVFNTTPEGGVLPSSARHAAGACFSPDDRFVVGGGGDDGTIHCWDAKTGRLLKTLEGHAGRVGCVAFNPKLGLLASACTNTALWIW